jgi:hypothetical protein
MNLSMFRRRFRKGDWVVYRRLKCTTRPGRRAQDVYASPNGDSYDYFVNKFWVVDDVLPNGNLLLRTRRGKTHVVGKDDLNLRHATLWDSILNRRRFIELEATRPASSS